MKIRVVLPETTQERGTGTASMVETPVERGTTVGRAPWTALGRGRVMPKNDHVAPTSRRGRSWRTKSQ